MSNTAVRCVACGAPSEILLNTLFDAARNEFRVEVGCVNDQVLPNHDSIYGNHSHPSVLTMTLISRFVRGILHFYITLEITASVADVSLNLGDKTTTPA